MTSQKKLKQHIRARMEKTGESYMTARRNVVGVSVTEGSGIHPDSSAATRALADAGIAPDGRPLTESMVLGLGGGLGAGYILWEFSHTSDSRSIPGVPVRRVVTVGFSNRWQYPDRWLDTMLGRLGVEFRRDQTGGRVTAARQLDDALARGRTVIADVSVADLPYMHLPEEERGWWGYPIAVTGRQGDGYLVHDRSQGQLTMSVDAMVEARARISSWKNRMVTVTAPGKAGPERLREGIEEALRDQVSHLASKSDSFSLPAFRKWARMVTSETGKGWKRVFADGQGLWSALRSTHEGVSDDGMAGGSLRALYAEFLVEAASLVDRRGLLEVADFYRLAADAWDDVGDSVLPSGFEPLREAADLAKRRIEAVRRGDVGDRDAAEASAGLLALARAHDPGLPLGQRELDDLLSALSTAIESAYSAEQAAHRALSETMGG